MPQTPAVLNSMHSDTLRRILESSASAVQFVRCEAPAGLQGDSLSAEVQRALEAPLDFPPLSAATVPGDRVALALSGDVPLLPDVVAGLLQALVRTGIETDNIHIVLAAEAAHKDQLLAQVRSVTRDSLAVECHAPEQIEHLAFLGVTSGGREVRINRTLYDADVVLPVRCVQSTTAPTRAGQFLFPYFADAESLRVFYRPSSSACDSDCDKLAHNMRDCDWMAGVKLCLELVPGSGNSIAKVLCGTPEKVAAESAAACAAWWSPPPDIQGELVVALMERESVPLTWQHVAQGLYILQHLLPAGSALALVTNLRQPPGKSLHRLFDLAGAESAEGKLTSDGHYDSWAALLLSRLLQQHPIFFKSDLKSSVVERLGMAPIASDQQLHHLIGSFPRCVVLDQADLLQGRGAGTPAGQRSS